MSFSWKLGVEPSQLRFDLISTVFLALFICVMIAYTNNVIYVVSFSGREGCITTQLHDFL